MSSPPTSPKVRWQALDGLRGLAALVVMFSHTGFSFAPLLTWGFPGRLIEYVLYALLTPGGMAVQILFVLCGFLMATLYAHVPSKSAFLHKRYTRIFPLYTAIVTYAYIWHTHTHLLHPILNLCILLAILLTWHIGWMLIARSDGRGYIRLGITVFFILFQVVVIIGDIAVASRYIRDSGLQISESVRGPLMYINNLTLTTAFLRYIGRYQGPYWSLGLEVMFYIVYALLIAPFLERMTRLPRITGMIVIASVLAIIFSLDSGFRTTLELINLSFNRSSGFLIGIILGTAYKEQNILHHTLTRFSGNKLLMFFMSSGVFLCLLMNRSVPFLGSYEFMMWYWLGASILIGLTLYMCLLPGTLAYRIFSMRFLVYAGTISYSLYLVHEHMVPILDLVRLSDPLTHSIVRVLLQLLISGAVASVSYYLVERPYFVWRTPSLSLPSVRIIPQRLAWPVGIGLIVCIISASFQASVSPRLQAFYLPLTRDWTIYPLATTKIDRQHPLRTTFVAPDNYLASIALDLQYYGENEKYRSHKDAARLKISLIGPDGKILATSDKLALEVAGQPYFPVGIPTQPDSKGKVYNIYVEVTDRFADDHIFIRTSRHNLITIHQYPLTTFREPQHLLTHLWGRLVFGLSHTNALLILCALMVVALTVHIARSSIHKKRIV